ncbi:MAG: S8 family serine peptidase, partial [Acidimicrobiia bacterium]|nr:S8 family serine peptidase [Acidimicrobiia bacterium]
MPIAALALAVLVAAGTFPTPPPDTKPEVVPGRFAVATPFAPPRAGEAVLGFTVFDGPVTDDPQREAELLSRDLGSTVVPVVMYEMFDQSEPRFEDQWALRNLGQSGGTPGADIGAVETWRWHQGGGSVIAVIDSGIDADHIELASRVWSNPGEIAGNGVDDDSNGYVDDTAGWDFTSNDPDPDDTVGHGTAVASVVVAAVNQDGMTGVAPQAQVMALKACGAVGCPADSVAEAIVYAVDNGADAINISLGAPGIEPLVAAGIEYAEAHDVLVVAAAGNDGVVVDDANPWTPASIESPVLISVAWTTDSDTLADSSNRGPTKIELAAPGDNILTATLGGGYAFRSGTSYAAPHV